MRNLEQIILLTVASCLGLSAVIILGVQLLKD